MVAVPYFLPYSNLYPNKPTNLFLIKLSEIDKPISLLPLTLLIPCHEPDAIEPALMKSSDLAVVHANEPHNPLLIGYSNLSVNDLWYAPSLLVNTAPIETLSFTLTPLSLFAYFGLLSTPASVPTGASKLAL